jgi:hypothetical protein
MSMTSRGDGERRLEAAAAASGIAGGTITARKSEVRASDYAPERGEKGKGFKGREGSSTASESSTSGGGRLRLQ